LVNTTDYKLAAQPDAWMWEGLEGGVTGEAILDGGAMGGALHATSHGTTAEIDEATICDSYDGDDGLEEFICIFSYCSSNANQHQCWWRKSWEPKEKEGEGREEKRSSWFNHLCVFTLSDLGLDH